MLTLGKYETGVYCWGCTNCYWHVPLVAKDGQVSPLAALNQYNQHDCTAHHEEPETVCSNSEAGY